MGNMQLRFEPYKDTTLHGIPKKDFISIWSLASELLENNKECSFVTVSNNWPNGSLHYNWVFKNVNISWQIYRSFVMKYSCFKKHFTMHLFIRLIVISHPIPDKHTTVLILRKYTLAFKCWLLYCFEIIFYFARDLITYISKQ